MKTTIIICPTLRRAQLEWKKLSIRYTDLWTMMNSSELSLTSIYDTKYIFHVSREENKLRGYGKETDFVSIDEFELFKNKEEK